MTDKNTGFNFRKLWFALSIVIAAAGLFGALYWGPNHDQSTGLYWAIFALMSFQVFMLWKEMKK